MTETFTLEVEELGSRENAVEIEVTVEYHWDNDGIGEYEYWGHREVDRGVDYVEIDKTDFDKTGFTPEELVQIEAAIEKELDNWAEKIRENDKDKFDEPDEPDYD